MQLQRQRNCRDVATSIRLRDSVFRIRRVRKYVVTARITCRYKVARGEVKLPPLLLHQERDHLFIIPLGTQLRAAVGPSRFVPSFRLSHSVRRTEFKFSGFRSPTPPPSSLTTFLTTLRGAAPVAPTIVFSYVSSHTSVYHTFPVSGQFDDGARSVPYANQSTRNRDNFELACD